MLGFMDHDSYGEIINGPKTYKEIAYKLLAHEPVIIGWTDEKYTHLDLLFTYNCYKEGMLQRGLKGYELYVSIISFGSFGFDIEKAEKSPGYISEKLNITGNPTIDKLAELINNIIKNMRL